MPVAALRTQVRDALWQHMPYDRDHPWRRRTETMTNAGLELGRYPRELGKSGEQDTARSELLRHVANAPVPDDYARAFHRWEAALKKLPHIQLMELRVQGRLIVGLGNASVLESGITLSRAWGMPFIPGSALKGLANHTVVQELGSNDKDFCPAQIPTDARPGTPPPLNAHGVLFGTAGRASYVTWHDAWWIPGSGGKLGPFRRDVITVHHPGYYQGRGGAGTNPPWDFDDPNPVSFLSVAGAFLVAVQTPGAEWGERVEQVLRYALAERGVGGKTGSGYGFGTISRIEIEEQGGNGGDTPAFSSSAAVELWDDLVATGVDRIGDKLGGWKRLWDQIDAPDDKQTIARQFAQLLETSPETKQRLLEGNREYQRTGGKKGRGPNAFVQQLVAAAGAEEDPA